MSLSQWISATKIYSCHSLFKASKRNPPAIRTVSTPALPSSFPVSSHFLLSSLLKTISNHAEMLDVSANVTESQSSNFQNLLDLALYSLSQNS
jgi:hypothetical protein